MNLLREHVAYMAQQTVKRLSAAGLIQLEQPDYVREVMVSVMLDEMGVEDRINDEVRKILEEHDSEMKEMGASYEEMFKRVKNQLVRERSVIL
ncbi:MAG TPA: DUF507 family protein [Terriglobia bacterium]|nr:DUF507 family protein [Terriglobia bacterium]